MDNSRIETESPAPPARPAKRDPYRLVGEILAERYRLDDYAGGGGMGAVYRSWDLANDRLIAVKILKPDLMEREPSYATLFQREVDAARALNHPHIVRVFDNGNTGDVSFMAMEWLDGQTLQEVVDGNPLTIDRVRTVFAQICRAFGYAHEQRVIHLDVKPANIFLLSDKQPADFIKVIDFGLARLLSHDGGTTVTRFAGTPQYCSPEHYGGKVSWLSDIYSLGATLYFLLAGTVPFGPTYVRAKELNLELPACPSLLEIRNDLPVAVDQIIRKALSRTPSDRPQSAKLLLDEWNKLFHGTPRGSSVEAVSGDISDLISSLLPDTVKDESVLASATLLEATTRRHDARSKKTDRSGSLSDYQDLIISKAIESTLRAASSGTDKRAGIARQTAGTGLGTTVAHYLHRVLMIPELSTFRCLVVSDRSEQSYQLSRRYSDLFHLVQSDAVHVWTKEQLLNAFRSTHHRMIFTTVQLLQRLSENEQPANDLLFVGFDLHGYSPELMESFSRAVSILFTTSPVTNNSAAVEMFGNVIAKYSIEQAINDNLLLPVRLERRVVFSFPSDTDDELPAVQRIGPRIQATPEFLNRVAIDIVKHFDSREQLRHGKALIVVPNLSIGSHLYMNLLSAYSAAHNSENAAEVINLISSALNSEDRAMLAHRFMDPDDPFKMAITSGMWLTSGINTRLLNTIYLLKPLTQKGLIQVISKVTKPASEGQFGLVVDYVGITETL